MTSEEWLPLVNVEGQRVGKARRAEVHGNPKLLHPVVHCLVVNVRAELLLQLRSLAKDVQPGRWDTSVGGHVGLDEPIEQALVREINEELGISVVPGQFSFLHRYVMQSPIESELVHTYLLPHEGPFVPEPFEIDELRFWTVAEIDNALTQGVLTPNFEDEFARYQLALREGRIPHVRLP